MAKKNIYNFDFGTLTDEQEILKLSISKEQFSNSRKTDIEDLKTSDDERFLPIQNITEDDDYYNFYFVKGNQFKNGLKLKNEEYPVKISIAQEILRQDILHEYETDDLYVSVNPSTIYYHPMRTVKYTYSGNQYMPKAHYTTLQMYKACVASILSNIPYEKCLTTPEDVAKEANEFIQEIFEKNSVAELLAFITDSKDYIEYDYIQSRTKEKSKWQNILIATASILSVVAIGGILMTNAVKNNQEEALANEYETTIQHKDLTIQANEQMNNGEYEQAIQSYTEAEADLSKVAEDLIDRGQYQLALNIDEQQLETIIKKYYEADNKNGLQDLNSENLSEATSTKLADEQAIAEGDKNAMMNVLNFLEDENTAVRLTEAFVNQNDLNNAQKVQEKYPDNPEIARLLEKGDLQSQISQLEEQIKNEKNDDKKKDLENQLNDTKKKLEQFS